MSSTAIGMALMLVSTDPRIQVLQRAHCLGEAEVGHPSSQIARQVGYHLLDAGAARATGELSDSVLQSAQRLWTNGPLARLPVGEGEAEKLACRCRRHLALRRVDAELETPRDEVRNALHHSLAGSLTADVNLQVSRPGESHPEALSEPDLNL